MSKLTTVVLLFIAASCNTPSNEPAKPAEVSDKPASVQSHEYSSKASYSTDFEIADWKEGEHVLTLWRYYDNNQMDSLTSHLADSVSVITPDFDKKMQKDSLVAGLKADRARFTKFSTTLDAIVPLQAKGKDELIVAIWGEEHAVKDGKESVRNIHELWGIGKDGKVQFIHQYASVY